MAFAEDKESLPEPQPADDQAPQVTTDDAQSKRETKSVVNRVKENFTKNKKKALIGLAIVVGFSALTLTLFLILKKETTTKVTPKGGSLLTKASLAGEIPRFAEFSEDKTTITPTIPKYTLSRSEISNLLEVESDVNKELTEEQLSALEKLGFFVTPAENLLSDGDAMIDFDHGGAVDEFVDHYFEISGDPSYLKRKPQDTVFITSDFILHSYHVFIDRTFQYIEQTEFHPKLLQLTNLMFAKSLEEYQIQKEEKLKSSFSRNTAFYLVAKVLLESSASKKANTGYYNPEADQQFSQQDENADKYEAVIENLSKYKDQVPFEIFETAKQEVELIMKSEGAYPSPLYGKFRNGQQDDYTQFKPRSHYEKNSILRSYWRAMIWYGRNGFLTDSDDLTLDAFIQTLLLTSTSEADQVATELWESIYLPTVFFVGKSDDLTFYDYADVLNKVFTNSTIVYEDLVDPAKFELLKGEIENLEGPKIQSSIIAIIPGATTKEELLEETKSFRFMGQRFIPDSFIYSTLTQGDEAPDEETGQKLPPIPTALMAMSIFGSERAEQHLNNWITQEAPDSDKVIAKEKQKLETAFGQLEVKDWTQNLYWSWLYTLKTLFQEYSEGYPVFMQSIAWQDKDLNSSLGSYTELRHDTLLYAKQSYAEIGGGGPTPIPPPVPKGYVEPNLLFLNRIIALAEMTKEGLGTAKVLPDIQKHRLESLIETFRFFKDIAIKELQNQTISDEDFEKLRVEVIKMNRALIPPDVRGYVYAKDTRAGLIADIHTAMTQEVQEILYEATGIPQIIYVAVKDVNGTRLTRGVTYSYYEFTRPFGERLSDSDWQANIYEGQKTFTTPEIPDWVKSLQK